MEVEVFDPSGRPLYVLRDVVSVQLLRRSMLVRFRMRNGYIREFSIYHSFWIE